MSARPSAQPPAALELRDLVVPFGEASGLEPVSFAVGAGERLVLAGPSGVGKTSLLRAIAGLGSASAGQVLVRGADVGALPPERRDVAYLHQSPLLFPHLTVGGNVAFPLEVRGVPVAEVRARTAAALRAVRLEEFGRRMPATLSGGQRHRVALARSMVARPAVLLLDEPLAALDPVLRDEVRESLLALQHEYGPALVVVTHELEEASLLGDRIGVLLDRRLVQLAPPAELFARPTSLAVARFLGFPNELRGRVTNGRLVAEPFALPAPPGIPRGEAVAVFGADALKLDASDVAGVPARVVSLRHRLRASSVVVEVHGRRLEASVPMHGALPPPGAAVRLTLDTGRVLVYAQDAL